MMVDDAESTGLAPHKGGSVSGRSKPRWKKLFHF